MYMYACTTYEEYDMQVGASGAREGSDPRENHRVREEGGQMRTGWMDGGILHSPCHGTPWQMGYCQSSAELSWCFGRQ